MTEKLAQIFHHSRDEEAAKADETRQAPNLDDGCMYPYCPPSPSSSLTQYPSAFPASPVERDEISGLDPFLILGLPRTFHLDSNLLDQAFRKLAAIHHPDQADGSITAFQDLQEAATILRNPVKRLRYLAGVSESSSPSLPTVATSLFPIIVTQLQESDSLIKKYQSTQGILAKATMIDKLMKARQNINAVLASIEQWKESLEQELRDLDTASSGTSSQKLLELAHSFNFAHRWENQLHERELLLKTLL